MKPLLTYLRDFFAYKRVIDSGKELKGLAKADSLLKELINSNKIPGLAITVLKNGNLFFEKGYGYANIDKKEKVNPQTSVFRIASLSKPIATTALAHMVSEDVIDLDKSFYTYVPYFPKKKWDFTIRQLASHTAGIRGYLGKEYALNKPYSIKESIAIFKDDELLFKPGTNYYYNSYDFVLLSLAMQEASGIPFEKYVLDRVLQPLGLSKTFACNLSGRTEVSSKELQLTIFYSKNRLGFRKAIPVNNYYKLAGGGFLATSSDIAKFGQAYMSKNVKIDQKIISKFISSETIKGKKTYYGLGWQVSEDKLGRSYYGHIGNGVGGYSNFFIYPKEKMVVSILINCTNPKIQKELDEVVVSLLNS
ncbi:beta-lactamase family protein [Cellulophaga baltica]|uniref:serine hydrolase domain-containing protein n=1 Tax=Cellulophaga TaxID=104264 RepID=UPI001C06EDC5|nr:MULTISPECIES: serine hydrolase domain-containing protein [Cellulophaga]MBU2995105.1 beta-lactamase family protein [Cellulophaga baltica]MDO6766500.1 serine hydrolase domain-containing protein [Cellulophaga sp. 1_MG-2023]